MSRHTARENLFKLIYERIVNNEKNALTFNMIFNDEEESQKEYFLTVYNGVDEKFDFINKIIEKYSVDFAVGRIYKVDLAILILASYEILFYDDIPDVVAINEAVDLSKVYSTEKSSVFINGILASVKKDKENILSDERESENN